MIFPKPLPSLSNRFIETHKFSLAVGRNFGRLHVQGEVPKWSYRARLEIELGVRSLYVGSNPTLSAKSSICSN
jgi:hypothetical protein